MGNGLFTRWPTPWAYSDTHEGHEGLVTVFAANGRDILCTGDMEGCGIEEIQLAQLFAAAPDLLAACEAELEVYAGMDVTTLMPKTLARISALRAAVARARGE
jgi:hypothetical protein